MWLIQRCLDQIPSSVEGLDQPRAALARERWRSMVEGRNSLGSFVFFKRVRVNTALTVSAAHVIFLEEAGI